MGLLRMWLKVERAAQQLAQHIDECPGKALEVLLLQVLLLLLNGASSLESADVTVNVACYHNAHNWESSLCCSPRLGSDSDTAQP